METSEKPKPKISLPDLNDLPGYVQANLPFIRLDTSYDHLPPTETLKEMIKQAQHTVTSFRELGKSEKEIQKAVSRYLLGPVNAKFTLEHR